MWRLAVLTTGRQDYGILRSTIRELRADARFEPLLYAGGMHCSPRFGRSVELLRDDGCEVARELPFIAEPPDPVEDAAAAVRVVAAALGADKPDALMLAGDRSETLAAGVAASLQRVPIVHLHGGEESEGALDNAFRHALTKLSHLHLVSHAEHAVRVLQMGEPQSNVVVVGAPGLDHLYRDDLSTGPRLAEALGRRLVHPVVLVTVHPTTLADDDDPAFEARAVAAALEDFDGTHVVSQPNADRGGKEIREFWKGWAASRPNVVLSNALSDAVYWGLMREADVMVGNSSSGIVEAFAAGLPVVNVGDRQRGRLRGPGTVDVAADSVAIRGAMRAALDPRQRAAISQSPPLYPQGSAARRIVAALAEWLPRRSLRKTFVRVKA